MVFYRKYRRTGNRYARRGRSGYTMYKLYRKRNSAAQARQIYGLNKKLKRIQRLTKPEIKIAPLVQGTLRSDIDGVALNGVKIFAPINLTNLLPQGSEAQAGYDILDGRFARLQNITIKGVFTYVNASNADLEPVDLQRMLGYMRVVLVQTKTSRAAIINTNDVWTSTIDGTSTIEGEAGTALSAYGMIRAPLKIGLARIGKVISDKQYMLSDTRQAVNIKTKLRYVRNWYASPSESQAKGNVYMFVMLYNQESSVLSFASDVRFDYVSKCVYTDA